MHSLSDQTAPVRLRDMHAGRVASSVNFGTSGVRGRVAELSWDICYAYASAFLQLLVPISSRVVALGMDLRPSSPSIASACAAAIRNAGFEVDFCGDVPTPALALHARREGMACLMVTGSHLPGDYNGIKFFGLDGELSCVEQEAILDAEVSLPVHGKYAPLPNVNTAPAAAYVRRLVDFFPRHALSGLRLGVFQHSSVARDIVCSALGCLGAHVVPLGRSKEFAAIESEAMSEFDVGRVKHWVVEHELDAVLSADGDGDRPLLADENGDWLNGDVLGILCARYLGAQAVATTVNCNSAVDECGSFAKVITTKIGSPYLVAAVRRLIAGGYAPAVAFEPGGGFLLGSNVVRQGRRLPPLPTRDALLPMLCLLVMAKDKHCRLSQLPSELPSRYTASGRVPEMPVAVSREIMQHLLTARAGLDELLGGIAAPASRMNLTDGLRIYLANDEIVHFRPSVNQPELRCYAESASRDRADFLVRSCLERFVAQRQRLHPIPL